jgi:hypothetical protein
VPFFCSFFAANAGAMAYVSKRFEADSPLVTERLQQGCQICLGPNYQNGDKYTKLPQNIPNGHKIFPMSVKQTKWS